MDKMKFFNILDKVLKMKKVEKADDILRDYEEYFLESYKLGKTDEEIIKELGDPVDLGFSYSSENRNVKEEKSIIKYNETIMTGNAVMKFLAFSLILIGSIILTFADVINFLGFLLTQLINSGLLILGILDVKKLKKIKAEKKDLENIEKKDV